jgi:ATP-binding protein involved in chromosome partitioning
MTNSIEELVTKALQTVHDPDLKRDLVSLNMIRDLAVQDGNVSFRVVLTTPACPLKAKIESDCRNAVSAVPGVKNISVKIDSEVRAKKTAGIQGANRIEGVSHIIAVSSGKGGVGKSTVAVNLATALAMEGARVGLMDADIYGPNVPTMMGVVDQPKIIQDPVRGELFIPPISHRVKVISMGFLIQGDQPVVWRGPMLHSVVNQFCYKVDWGQLDYLIIDMPPGTGDVQLSLAQLVPITGAILVTTPQEVALQDVRKAYYMFEKVRVPMIGIVENMSYFKCDECSKQHHLFGQGGGNALAKKFKTELLAQVPLVAQVREGGDEGRPIVIRNSNSEISELFRTLARTVAQRTSILVHETLEPSQIIKIGRFN